MHKPYMLDTDISSYIIKQFNDGAIKHYNEHFGGCCISAATYGELVVWDIKRNNKRLTESIRSFVRPLDIIPLDDSAMRHYAKIRAELEQGGIMLDNMDMMIAATAINIDAVLVTNNFAHFSRISGLKLENWIE